MCLLLNKGGGVSFLSIAQIQSIRYQQPRCLLCYGQIYVQKGTPSILFAFVGGGAPTHGGSKHKPSKRRRFKCRTIFIRRHMYNSLLTLAHFFMTHVPLPPMFGEARQHYPITFNRSMCCSAFCFSVIQRFFSY